MGNFTKHFFSAIYSAIWLLAVGLFLQSCNEHDAPLEKQKVVFTLSPVSAYGGRVTDIELSGNATARISVTNAVGRDVLSNHEITVFRQNGRYVTAPVELVQGTYAVTDFIIVQDDEELYVTPKKGAEVAVSETKLLPYSFAVRDQNSLNLDMEVAEVRGQDLLKFGYALLRGKTNTLSLSAYHSVNGKSTITRAKAELRQNNKLLGAFSLNASVNTISFGGDPNGAYALTVYTGTSAKTQTFNLKQLKKDLGKRPLKVDMDPALVLTIESFVEPGNETEEYFNFRMEGSGNVNVNWGDGNQSPTSLPFEISHEYIEGNYTAIITGDIGQVTDFSGFSYGTIISAITGLPHLTSLKTYNPSWGAVPIKVDLSNCTQLETINIAKYGAPYEPVNLQTDFKLPANHNISTFIFDGPSFDSEREYISAAELAVMVDNIYNNAVADQIFDGKFYVNPVVAPAPETQAKLDVLETEFNWDVRFNDEIYDGFSSESGRVSATAGLEGRREKWIRERFSNSQAIIKAGKAVSLAE